MILPSVLRTSIFNRTVVPLISTSLLIIGVATLPPPAAPQASTKKAVPQRKPLTQADVQKLWTGKDDKLLTNELRLRGLAFTPTGEWLDIELPKITGVSPSDMPLSITALRKLVPAPLDVDEVARQAPDLLTSLKAAVQKRSDSEIQPLVDPALMANKARVYELFDTANSKAYSLGKPAEGEHGDVGLPFFQLKSGNVEELYYIYFGRSKGKLVVRDIVTGDQVADLYSHDEQALAKSKLEVMFRALNDGDQSGLKNLCSPGLYEAIQAWGGDKHPGDRLSRGHGLSQVSLHMSAARIGKSIHVVSEISYPVAGGGNIAFLVDFERIDNDLKIVRIRDTDNKVIVFDPNFDNYVNRRYGLPDDPAPSTSDVAMTDRPEFLSHDQLLATAQRAMRYQDLKKISEISRIFVESNPTSAEGYGLRSAAELMQHKIEDADKDAHKALELGGTAYFVLERYTSKSAKPFTPVVLGISKAKIAYVPGPGFGSPEDIPMQLVDDFKFAKGIPGIMKAGPFLKLNFRSSDGKKKLDYDFADYGTTCPDSTHQAKPGALIEVDSNGTCGAASTNGQVSGAYNVPILAPETWHEDLAVIAELVNSLKGHAHK